MAEAGTLKRQREETRPVVADEQHGEDTNKRHKSYNQILSLLETEEDEQNPDLSSLMSTLEHELSCDYYDDSAFDSLSFTLPENNDDLENPASASGSTNTSSSEPEEDDKERVIRHLLEASDDELGIPQAESSLSPTTATTVVRYGGEDEINGGDLFVSVCDGLWELEDEAANYYTYLQSELFM